MSNYLPRKQKLNPKKSSIEVIIERMQNFLDIVMASGIIKDIDLQIALGLGNGQYYSVKTAIKSRYPDFVEWNKKPKTWKWIAIIPEKFTKEEDSTISSEAMTIE